MIQLMVGDINLDPTDPEFGYSRSEDVIYLLADDNTAYQLTFSDDCRFEGCQERSWGPGYACKLGGRVVHLYSNARYVARGEVETTGRWLGGAAPGDPRWPIVLLKATCLECLQAGKVK